MSGHYLTTWAKHEGAFDDAFFKDFTTSPATGIKYKIISNPTGERPVVNQRVYMHYTGYLLSGKQFDSSYSKADPFYFRIGKGKVIRGWESLAQGMVPGTKVIALIPPDFGYGEKGIGPIPPNAQLVFYMEMMGTGEIRGDKPRIANLVGGST